MPLAWDYDAAILGGGPAGSAAAAAIARAGGRALVLERESFPRFHIGESLMPQSNEVFEALGLSETVARAGFVEKRGASFLLADGDHPIRLGFDNANGVREPRTFNVDRARFDQLLLDHAEAQGAEVRRAYAGARSKSASAKTTAPSRPSAPALSSTPAGAPESSRAPWACAGPTPNCARPPSTPTTAA